MHVTARLARRLVMLVGLGRLPSSLRRTPPAAIPERPTCSICAAQRVFALKDAA